MIGLSDDELGIEKVEEPIYDNYAGYYSEMPEPSA